MARSKARGERSPVADRPDVGSLMCLFFKGGRFLSRRRLAAESGEQGREPGDGHLLGPGPLIELRPPASFFDGRL